MKIQGKLFFLLLLFVMSLLNAQQKSILFPAELNVQPFIAGGLEPRLGFFFHVNESALRLDIGNTMDFAHFNLTGNGVLSAGADLFTYTLLRGESNFHFPVDAIDYLFGINFGYKMTFDESEFGARFRLSHISAHFVDGHYDGKAQKWRDDHNPRVFSREFLEFIPFYRRGIFRFYGGFSYLFHVDPGDLGKDSYQTGMEIQGNFIFGEKITPFFAYDFKLVNIYSYTGINSLTLGFKYGKMRSRGVSLYFSYYSGKSLHGQYFEQNNEYAALGINLDL